MHPRASESEIAVVRELYPKGVLCRDIGAKVGRTASWALREADHIDEVNAIKAAIRRERACFFTKDNVARMDEILAVWAQLRREIFDELENGVKESDLAINPKEAM